MIKYEEYLDALKDAFSKYKEWHESQMADKKRLFDDDERRMKKEYKEKSDSLKAEIARFLNGSTSDLSAVINNGNAQKINLVGQQKELSERREELYRHYCELEAEANEKSDKREYVRGRLFSFWWSSKNDG